MKPVHFDPAELDGEKKDWWEKWLKKADAATAEIIARWEAQGHVSSGDFRSDVWADLKEWLLENVFSGKCAYCETRVAEARQPGHAEHFRPKGGIKNKIQVNGKARLMAVKSKDAQGMEIEHPGYFWLAYCWENLVPSCNDCNTGRGKNNQFPVRAGNRLLHKLQPSEAAVLKSRAIQSGRWPGYYYLSPPDLDPLEETLLLHPYYDDPRKHITFGIKGIESPKEIDGKVSEKGRASIETYELDGGALRRARQKAQLLAWNIYSVAKNSAINNGMPPDDAKRAGWAAVTATAGKDPEFSAAIEDFIELFQR